MITNCPEKLNERSVIKFLNDLWRQKDNKELTLDFSNISFAKPSGSLLLAFGIRKLSDYRNSYQLISYARGHSSKNDALSYLRYMGFFELAGISLNNTNKALTNKKSHLPIRTIKRDKFNNHEVLQVQIESLSEKLAQVIFSKRNEFMQQYFLAYCIRELIRNVFEHADTNECFLIGQKWKNGIAEITVGDEGIGVLESLNKINNEKSVRSALKKCLLPGISGSSNINSNDYWSNSGYGLYVISELGKKFGSFSIACNNSLLSLSKSKTFRRALPLRGTIVTLTIDTSSADYFPNIIEQIVKRGEKIAESISGAHANASKSVRSKNRTLF